jgi:3-hydroxybutyrate dehydrogenase
MVKARSAIVTGSTSGIGLAIARRLAAGGADVVLNAHTDTDDDRRTADDLAREFGVRTAYVKADMGSPQEARALVEEGHRRLGRLDILVNNAGIQHVEPIETFPTERWDAIIAVNLSAAFHTSAMAIPLMRATGFGRIVNIASAHGLRASVNKSAYVAAKHGIVGLSKVIALENAEAGITCNAVCPGFVLTPLVDRQIEDLVAETGLDRETVIRERVLSRQPTREFATVEQIAASVAFLCGEDAAQITGTTLSVDGGWTAM